MLNTVSFHDMTPPKQAEALAALATSLQRRGSKLADGVFGHLRNALLLMPDGSLGMWGTRSAGIGNEPVQLPLEEALNQKGL